MAQIDALFESLLEREGSDLHLSAGRIPMIREHGDMVELDVPISRDDDIRHLLCEIMPEKNRLQLESEFDTDFAYELPGRCRLRANVFFDRHGMGAVFRVIPNKILTAEDLHLPQGITDLCFLSKGLVLVTGPTGSGKSTTLAAMIDLINRSRSDHIITIEDPIEFVHKENRCLVNQREVGNHTKSFASALRAALREDPDIVLVGEMRDLETIEIAIETAETGHLVFGTLHTSTAPGTVDRIIDAFPSGRQNQIRSMLSSSLKGAVSQVLCRKKGGGRVAALELMIVNGGIAALIRDGKTFQIPSAMQVGGGDRMMLLNDSLAKLVRDDLVDPKEAYIKAIDKQDLLQRFKKMDIPLPDLTAKPAASEKAVSAAGQPEPARVSADHEAGTKKLATTMELCGHSFQFVPLAQADMGDGAPVYVILGVDKWSKWNVLDSCTGSVMKNSSKVKKMTKAWYAQCPSRNIWVGILQDVDDGAATVDPVQIVQKIREIYHLDKAT